MNSKHARRAMSRKATLFVLLLFVLSLASSLLAQMQAPPPGPEVKKLDYFAGDWKSDADMKPDPMMPNGGKVTGTDHFEWMKGGYFLVGHTDFKMSNQSGAEMSVLGYDPKEKVYTYNAFNSMGQNESSKGTVNGDTWTWTGDADMGGGQVMKGRFTMKIVSPTVYTYAYDISP